MSLGGLARESPPKGGPALRKPSSTAPGPDLQGGEFHPVKLPWYTPSAPRPLAAFTWARMARTRFLHRVHRVLPGKDLSAGWSPLPLECVSCLLCLLLLGRHLFLQRASFITRSGWPACLNWKLTLLAMSRALMGTMVSMGVQVILPQGGPRLHNIHNHVASSPKMGAISMEPWSRMMSMSRLRAV